MAHSKKYPHGRPSSPGDLSLVSLQEGAQTIGVCVKTLRNWISEGRLTGYRLGPRAIRIDRNELFALARPLAGAHTRGVA